MQAVGFEMIGSSFVRMLKGWRYSWIKLSK